MTKTIEALRKVADECQKRANHPSDRGLKAELCDLAVNFLRKIGGDVGCLCSRATGATYDGARANAECPRLLRDLHDC